MNLAKDAARKAAAYALARLKERSTWLGLMSVLTAAGVHISPEMQPYVLEIVLGAAGLVAVIAKDKK